MIGRKAGSLAGFRYSPAMAQAGLTWDEKTLDQFLTSSTVAVPGTAMAVQVATPTDRANIACTSTRSDVRPRRQAQREQKPRRRQSEGERTDTAELLHAGQDQQNWLYARKDYSGQRFVDLRQIRQKRAHPASDLHRSLGEDGHDPDQPDRLQGGHVRDARQRDRRDRCDDLP